MALRALLNAQRLIGGHQGKAMQLTKCNIEVKETLQKSGFVDILNVEELEKVMGRCKVPPYEGEKNYIFVSYSHHDENTVYPILETLSHCGYRIWYDEGIVVGSEWPEMIANHMGSCSAVVAFITNNSINSHNCRREVNYALMKQKPVVSIVLEPVVLSLGMEMQLSTTQAVFKYQILDEKVFMLSY